MEKKPISYIKADNDMIINEKYIRWIKKINDCLEVCTKSSGCISKYGTHQICKFNNPNSYKKLIELFE
jgi:hypothetical protein